MRARRRESALRDLYPIRRLGTPGDAAFAAPYLASEHASRAAGVIIDAARGAVMV
jgi:NAD(P)-dependent dehydrogenase (short-subunit alcohol dehydrogenase family)